MKRTNSTIRTAATAMFITTLGLASASAWADLNFDAAVSTVVGSQPSGVAAGDFDGDGDLDLAATVDNPDRVVLLANDGAGNYTLAGSVLLPNSSSPGKLVAGDFDGNGTTDLAVALKDNAAIIILSNGGAMNFTATGTFGVGDEPRGLAIGDIDGDGDLDLAVANRDGNSASVLTNSGGSFTVQTFAAGQDPRDVAFGDFDGDGDMDLAVSSHDTRQIILFTNTGGAFAQGQSLSTGALLRPEGVTAADLDGNGTMDIASGTGDPERASVWLNNGGGAFSARVDYPTSGANTSEIIAADLDCDGFAELVTVNADSNTLSVLPNLGNGTFGAAMLLGTGTDPQDVIAADIDGDGDSDLITVNQLTNDASIIVNQSCQPGGGPAVLTDANVFFGFLLGGGVNELQTSDDAYLRTRSNFGFSLIEPNLMELHIGFTTDQLDATTLDFSSEERINNPNGVAKIRFRNWSTNGFEQVGTYPVSNTETVSTLPGIPAINRVRADGRIEVSMKHVVNAVFSALGFDSSIDHIEVITN